MSELEFSFEFLISYLILYSPHIFFCVSIYKALKRIPKEQLSFPIWFVWMLLVPVVNIIFVWIMIPFGIPRPFERAVAGNEEASNRAKTLTHLGTGYAVLATLSYIPSLSILFIIPFIVVWIIYWVKIVHFRISYLERLGSTDT